MTMSNSASSSGNGRSLLARAVIVIGLAFAVSACAYDSPYYDRPGYSYNGHRHNDRGYYQPRSDWRSHARHREVERRRLQAQRRHRIEAQRHRSELRRARLERQRHHQAHKHHQPSRVKRGDRDWRGHTSHNRREARHRH